MMMTDLLMPLITDAMEEGTIVKWLVTSGQVVAAGDEIAEIETDKATTPLTADVDGYIEIVAPEGTTASVGSVIARIDASPASSQAPSTPAPESAAEPAQRPPDAAVPTVVSEPLGNGNGNGTADNGRGSVATPLARRVAAVHDVALAGITGTGPRGRVTKLDVLRAAGIEPNVEPEVVVPVSASPDPGPIPEGATVQPATRLQQTIARRMSAQALIPVFQVQTDVRMGAAIALRAELKQLAGERPAPSVNDLIIRASALALRDHPLVNGSYRDDGFLLHSHINVGFAVASDAGLLVATVPDTDRKSLGQIASETRALARKVREGDATPAELTGGTFTVSNLGMFGMTEITAVINPPQAAILGVGSSRAVLSRDQSGEIVEEQLVALNLTCDHRILNGADGARFLQDVKAFLETPLRMAL